MLLDSDALDEALKSLDSVQLAKVAGRLVRVSGLILEGLGCHQPTGQRCYVEQTDGSLLEAQVVGFNREITYLMPFKKPLGLATGARIFPIREEARLRIDESWLGRVVNGLGEPLDEQGRLGGEDPLPPLPPPVNPLRRRPVEEPLDVGVRAINAALTLGKGQRVGLLDRKSTRLNSSHVRISYAVFLVKHHYDRSLVEPKRPKQVSHDAR